MQTVWQSSCLRAEVHFELGVGCIFAVIIEASLLNNLQDMCSQLQNREVNSLSARSQEQFEMSRPTDIWYNLQIKIDPENQILGKENQTGYRSLKRD